MKYLLFIFLLLFQNMVINAFDQEMAKMIMGVWTDAKTVEDYLRDPMNYKDDPGLAPYVIELSREAYLGWNSSIIIDPFARQPYLNDSGRVFIIDKINKAEPGKIEIVTKWRGSVLGHVVIVFINDKMDEVIITFSGGRQVRVRKVIANKK